MQKMRSIDERVSKLLEDSSQRRFFNSEYHFTQNQKERVLWYPDFDSIKFDDIIRSTEAEAHREAFDLIRLMAARSKPGLVHKIATAESLTGGMIFSTLVDVPIGGLHKYGAFGVYDTDAKRFSLGVDVDDVYTHLCARQMAVGVLRASNATIALSVSGNAMPEQGVNHNIDKLRMVGEVFIGVAGYDADGNIIAESKVINACERQYGASHFAEKWVEVVISETKLHETLKAGSAQPPSDIKHLLDGYNEFNTTALLSKYIRLLTTVEAFKYVGDFIERCNCIAPDFIEPGRYENNAVAQSFLRQNNNSTNSLIRCARDRLPKNSEIYGLQNALTRDQTGGCRKIAEYEQF